MTCEDIERDDVLERYLQGKLPEAESEALEQHFFSCRQCLEKLEILQGLPTALAQATAEARPRYAIWALAACLLLAIGAGVMLKTTPPTPAPKVTATIPAQAGPDPLVELAKFDPPRYDPPEFRGTQTPAMRAFQLGMAQYRLGAFAEASKHLAHSADLDPADAGAGFFLGICRLLLDDTSGGVEQLRRVDAMGATPYQEEARFYLAKAHLRRGDAASARQALAAIESMNGDLAGQARALLDRLNAIGLPR